MFTLIVLHNVYRCHGITGVLKVETDIIIGIAASPIEPNCDTSDYVCRDLQDGHYCFYRY